MCRGTILFARCDPNSLQDHCIGPLQAPQSHQLQPLQKPKQDRDAERNNRTTCAINQICTAPTANFQPSATPFSLFQTEAPVRDAALTAHLCLISTGFIFKYPFTFSLPHSHPFTPTQPPHHHLPQSRFCLYMFCLDTD